MMKQGGMMVVIWAKICMTGPVIYGSALGG